MDVHDTPELPRSQPLQPGMAITIEPGKRPLSLLIPSTFIPFHAVPAFMHASLFITGLYIGEDNNQVPKRFRGLGVRIEDDVVIQDKGGPLILSCAAPKTIADVEQACAQR